MPDPRMQTHYDRTGQTATTGGGHPERIDKTEPTVGPDTPSGVGNARRKAALEVPAALPTDSAFPLGLSVEATDEDRQEAALALCLSERHAVLTTTTTDPWPCAYHLAVVDVVARRLLPSVLARAFPGPVGREWAIEFNTRRHDLDGSRTTREYGNEWGAAERDFDDFDRNGARPKLLTRDVYRSPWVHDPGKEREIRDGS